MGAYTFYESRADITVTPKQSYINDFDAITHAFYENSPNFFEDLQQEKTYGLKDFEIISGIVDTAIDSVTGKSIGDDYKNFILFPDASKVYVGKMFYWKDNYWIAINTNTYESMTNSCIVKRCNNILKWIDENGVLNQEPCSIGYDIFSNKDTITSDYKLAAGQLTLYCQRNTKTNKIYPNMRFLFGSTENKRAYKINGDGIVNYLNKTTLDNYSASVLQITLTSDFPNSQTDDIANGIADAYKNIYTVSIDQDNISQSVGFTMPLTAKVFLNGENVSETINWVSSNATVCTVSSAGVINCLTTGSVTITARLAINSTITDTITVNVVATPVEEYDIRITPNILDIMEGTTETFNCKLYLNEVAQSDTFTYSIESIVPTYTYEFTNIDGNNFSIKNNRMYLTNALVVRCTSGTHIQDFNFRLRGAF